VLMRMLAAAGVIATLSLAAAEAARASLVVTIDKSAQRMTVAVAGTTRHVFKISTGRPGFGTPNGHFRPQRLARTWFSKQYYNSPMPHSIFFHEGYAIHGSYEIRRLGGPASHGCVRLHPADAAALFALVKSEGMANTEIVVTGTNPAPARSPLLARKAPERPPAVAESRLRPPASRASAYVAPAYAMRVQRAPAYRDYAPPVRRAPVYAPPIRGAQIYQDPRTGTLWTFGAGGSVRILAR
jgi:L,D-transpeptidase catalytic domain